MVTSGRIDPESGLPVRVTDFLLALDQIVDRAIGEKVDLVIFAGDAYKDRNPQPTYQREWGKRVMKLSAAGIPTVLLVGNHDVARGSGRAPPGRTGPTNSAERAARREASPAALLSSRAAPGGGSGWPAGYTRRCGVGPSLRGGRSTAPIRHLRPGRIVASSTGSRHPGGPAPASRRATSRASAPAS